MGIKIIKGVIHEDFRGSIKFVNDFNMHYVSRFYIITHDDIKIVRAWQGHLIEHKYFYVIKGSFIIAGVKIDDWNNPSENLKSEIFRIKSSDNLVLSIPPGYANGLKALEQNSQVMVFSSHKIGENIRFHSSLWFDWNAN